MQRGGYAGQGVALADIAACLYFDEMRGDDAGWFHDRFVLSNGHDAIMTYGALAEHGSASRMPTVISMVKSVESPGSTYIVGLRSPFTRDV